MTDIDTDIQLVLASQWNWTAPMSSRPGPACSANWPRDHAECTATFQAAHFSPHPYGEPLWTLGGNYHCQLRRTDSRWLIEGITMTAKWVAGNQHIMTLAAERES